MVVYGNGNLVLLGKLKDLVNFSEKYNDNRLDFRQIGI